VRSRETPYTRKDFPRYDERVRPSDVIAHRRTLIERVGPYDESMWNTGAAWNSPRDELRWILPTAAAYLVTKDMTALTLNASRTMPNQHLRRDDLPSDFGIIFYEAPIGRFPFADAEMEVIGAAWGVAGFVQSLPDDAEDEVSGPSDEDLTFVPLGFVPGATAVMPMPQPVIWVIGDDPELDPPRVDELGDDEASIGRTLLTTWTLMQQTISASTPAHADRAESRRSARGGLPADLVIIHLRRLHHEDQLGDEGVAVDWSHRWLVDGHWRNQWLPSRGCHRLQWINPHIKGPADKPLVLKERVSVWSR
jgi:hypothetical protein